MKEVSNGKYVLKCSRGKCFRRVRVVTEENCTIVIDGIDRGICRYFEKRRAIKRREPRYRAQPLGQVIYSLVAIQGKPEVSSLDRKIIGEFVTWLRKRFHNTRLGHVRNHQVGHENTKEEKDDTSSLLV